MMERRKTKMMTAALITTKDGKYYDTTATGTPGGGPIAGQLLDMVKSWKFC